MLLDQFGPNSIEAVATFLHRKGLLQFGGLCRQRVGSWWLCRCVFDQHLKSWWCRSVVELSLCLFEALGLIPGTEKKTKPFKKNRNKQLPKDIKRLEKPSQPPKIFSLWILFETEMWEREFPGPQIYILLLSYIEINLGGNYIIK